MYQFAAVHQTSPAQILVIFSKMLNQSMHSKVIDNGISIEITSNRDNLGTEGTTNA